MVAKRPNGSESRKIRPWNNSIPLLIFLLIFVTIAINPVTSLNAQEELPARLHLVEVGDTWAALSRRFNLDEPLIRAANPVINQQRQPVIGKGIVIPGNVLVESKGILATNYDGGLLQLAVQHNRAPWALAMVNDQINPYRPLLYRPILIPDGKTEVRELPGGFTSLDISIGVATPGEALAIRGAGPSVHKVTATLDSIPINIVTYDHQMVGLFGTGSFFPPGDHDLNISVEGRPMWSQPWLFQPGTWSFDEITLTGSAAAIDSESIEEEYERLSHVWAEVGGLPMWDSNFQLPIDNYLSISSEFGARRSYNGGPYRTYHEGVDFSAYGGTPVEAPANGTVVIAENLYVRGGAVIIDHGLGLFTGTYHLDDVLVQPGQHVSKGQVVGKVGSTGLSTGNHLHWDLLVGGTWVDPIAWLESDHACWILEIWETACASVKNG